MARINEGDEIGAGFLNRHEEAAEWFHRHKAQGESGEPVATPINNCVVTIRNSTGGHLRRGEVVELGPRLLTNPDPRVLSFSGLMPDLTNIGRAVTLQQIPSGSMDECLCVGVCIALVNVTDVNHRYAARASGELVLQSTTKGPAKILDKPAGTGELVCLVQLMDETGGDTVDIVQVYHSDEDPGAEVDANADGLHPGIIKRVIDETMTDQGECWILFVDDYGNVAGNVPAINSDYYGPGRLSGTWDFVEGEGEAATHDLRPLYVLRRGGGGASLVRFELLEALTLAGHAKAKLLTPASDGSWEDLLDGDDNSIEIEVYDPYRPEGMWAAAVGFQGLAYPRGEQFTDEGEDEEDEEDDVQRPSYDVVFMEQIAERVEGTFTERMGGTTGGQASAAVDYYDHQGKNPGSTITVHDPQNVYPDAHSGAKFSAAYDYHAGYYRIERCQRIAQFARATITAHHCGGSSVSISSFSVLPCGEYVGSPGTIPTTAQTATVMAGRNGDKVLLRRIDNGNPNPSWEVVRIDKHLVNLPYNIEVGGEGLTIVRRPFYVELCGETETPDEEPFLETTAHCPEEE